MCVGPEDEGITEEDAWSDTGESMNLVNSSCSDAAVDGKSTETLMEEAVSAWQNVFDEFRITCTRHPQAASKIKEELLGNNRQSRNDYTREWTQMLEKCEQSKRTSQSELDELDRRLEEKKMESGGK